MGEIRKYTVVPKAIKIKAPALIETITHVRTISSTFSAYTRCDPLS